MSSAARVNGATLAEVLGLSRARISQLTHQGLPRGEDRLFDFREALLWITNCASPDLAKRAAALLPSEESSPPAALPADDGRHPARQAIDRMLAARGHVPEVLVELGMKNLTHITLAHDLFEFFVLHLAGGAIDDLYDPTEYPNSSFDPETFARRSGLTYHPAAVDAADRLLERALGLLEKAQSREQLL